MLIKTVNNQLRLTKFNDISLILLSNYKWMEFLVFIVFENQFVIRIEKVIKNMLFLKVILKYSNISLFMKSF